MATVSKQNRVADATPHTPHHASGASTKVAVVVITYNSGCHLPKLLQSIPAASPGLDVTVIVVDNASRDDSVEVARAHGAMVVESGSNLGYSGGINLARAAMTSEVDALAILNPDLVLHPESLTRLVTAVSEHGVGIASPGLWQTDGHRFPHLRCEPTVLRAVGEALFGDRWVRRPQWLAEAIRRESCYERSRDVAWAGGAALVISAACNERTGQWDSGRYFLYSEETDYARRARDLGFSVRYVPEAGATHEGGGSGQSAELVALMSVNKVRYFASHHNRLHTSLYRLAVALAHALRLGDPRHRTALRYVLSRGTWADLPCGSEQGDSASLGGSNATASRAK